MRYMGRQQVTAFWPKLLTLKELCYKSLLQKALYSPELLDTQEVVGSSPILPIAIKLCKQKVYKAIFLYPLLHNRQL